MKRPLILKDISKRIRAVPLPQSIFRRPGLPTTIIEESFESYLKSGSGHAFANRRFFHDDVFPALSDEVEACLLKSANGLKMIDSVGSGTWFQC